MLKIVVLGLGAMLPLLASAVFFMKTYAGREIEFARLERLGLECARPMMRLLAIIPEHEAVSLGFISGAPTMDSRLAELAAEIQRAFAESAALSERLNAQVAKSRASESVPRLLGSSLRGWKELQRDFPTLGMNKRLDRYTAVVEGVQRTIRLVGDHSNLILDPEFESYNIAAVLVQSLPVIQTRRASGIAGGVIYGARTEPNESERRRLAVLASLLRDTAADRLLEEFRTNVANASAPSGGNAEWLVAGDRFETAKSAFLALFDQVIAAEPHRVPTQEFIQAGARVHTATVELWSALAGQLDHILEKRMVRLRSNSSMNLLLIGLAVLTSTGLTVAVGRSIFNRTKLQLQAEADIRQLNAELEARVADRTAQLLKFARAIEQSPSAVIISDAHRIIEFVNPHFTAIMGYTREEVIGRRTQEFLRSERHSEVFYEEIWQTIVAGREWHGEACCRKKGGELFWQHISIAPLRDATGVVTHIVGVMEDITERIRAQEALQAAKAQAEAANRSKSAFLANMSHEIRTPMNAVLGFAQLMLRDPALSPVQQEHLRIIDRNGAHLMELINDILEMSKIEANRVTLNRTAFDVPRLARDVESMFRARAEAKGLAFRVECAAGLPTRAFGDEGKLRQILINLLGNAVKFTAQGSVTLRLDAVPIEHNGWLLRAEVVDTGPGVPAAEQPRLFQPFEQTELGRRAGTGTGLGLAISREFARMMDGDITCQSDDGKGATFRVELVLDRTEDYVAVAARPAATRKVVRLTPGQPACRLLVVDDMEDNRRFLCQLLHGAGFEVHEAANGAAAVGEFERCQPHGILMDMHMPVMDGAEAIRRIRLQEPERKVKIVSLTASVFAANREQALAVGADDFLGKPFREADLFEILGTLLGVNYDFADEAKSSTERTARPAARVPREFVPALRRAVEEADLDRVLELIDEHAVRDPVLARELRELALHFDYPALLDRLSE